MPSEKKGYPNRIKQSIAKIKAELLKEDGFNEENADRILRLLTMSSTPEETAQWEKVGIIQNGKLCMASDEEVDLVMIVLWDLTYMEIIKRRVDGE